MITSPTVVQLGRFGDILNILPLVAYLAAGGQKPTLVVAQDFASIAEAISYANVRVFSGKFHEHSEAIRSLEGKFGKIIRPQCYGNGIAVTPTTESFCIESYARAGFLDEFRQGLFDHINIDVRHPKDEAEFAERVLPKNGLPNIIVNLCGGSSSIFQFGRIFEQRLRKQFEGRANIIEISNSFSRRFTDLLGLFDRAALLVTSDTGTLHLAGAHTIPYIAFIASNPSSWHGAYTRGDCLMRVRYHSAPHWAGVVGEVAESVLDSRSPGRRFIHVYSGYSSGNPHTQRRERVARQSWKTSYQLGNWKALPVDDEDCERMFSDAGRRLPFVKELLDLAFIFAGDENDSIVLTNTDTCFSPDISASLQNNPLVVGRRRDFHCLIDDPYAVTQVRTGHPYCGADLFVMPVAWWKQHRDEMPDMVLGAEGWDCVLAQLMLRYGAVESYDLVYHERHDSHWERAENRYTLPSQIHNLRLAASALRGWGLDPGQFGIREV